MSIVLLQIVVWWYYTKAAMVAWGNGMGVAGNGGSGGGSRGQGGGGGGGNSHASQHACSSLCDEIVVLWRLAALNPGLAPRERDIFHAQFTNWHLKILEKVKITCIIFCFVCCFFFTHFFWFHRIRLQKQDHHT